MPVPRSLETFDRYLRTYVLLVVGAGGLHAKVDDENPNKTTTNEIPNIQCMFPLDTCRDCAYFYSSLANNVAIRRVVRLFRTFIIIATTIIIRQTTEASCSCRGSREDARNYQPVISTFPGGRRGGGSRGDREFRHRCIPVLAVDGTEPVDRLRNCQRWLCGLQWRLCEIVSITYCSFIHIISCLTCPCIAPFT